MANLEYITYTPYRATVTDQVVWSRAKIAKVIDGLPQIYLNDGRPWREANVWALQRACSGELDIATVQTNMRHLCAYASFLESEKLDWRHFPSRKDDRCLVIWRGELIRARNEGKLKPSTASQRMAACIQFYRFAADEGLVSRTSPMWNDKEVVLRFFDSVGFERASTKRSTNLAVPNRKRHGATLGLR